MRSAVIVVFAIAFMQITGSVFGGLITNGDFSAGNSGFVTGYSFVPAPGTSASPGTYAIRTDPQNYNPGLQSFGDHTSGTGNMLLLDGVGSTTAWQQTLSVTANTTYSFSAWATPTAPPSPAVLGFTANGISLGSNLTLIPTPGVWQNFSASWNSGTSTSVTLSIFDLNTTTSSAGNDFALDDISLSTTAVPEPSSSVLLMIGGVSALLQRFRRRQAAN